MDWAQLGHALLELTEGSSIFVTAAIILFTVYLKRSDVSFGQVTKISELQTEQLTTLIKQNIELANSLHLVREELTKAYSLIEEMRDRINVLEDTLHRTEMNNNQAMEGKV